VVYQLKEIQKAEISIELTELKPVLSKSRNTFKKAKFSVAGDLQLNLEVDEGR